jgi:hypothetical protein
MLHLARFLSRLENVTPWGTGNKACCPGHDDKNPSLEIKLDDEHVIILRCRSANCSVAQILTAMDLSPIDLQPDPDDDSIPSIDHSQFVAIEGSPTTGDCDFADPELRHSIYAYLLSQLCLSDAHREDLHVRGIEDSEIDLREYRSIDYSSRQTAMAALKTEFTVPQLRSVPGICQNSDGELRLVGPPKGLLIPVRDTDAKIVALKVRSNDGHDTYGKYLYVSGGGGKSCGTPTHVPLGVQGPVPILRVTEGELKADIATTVSDLPTIGIPGVNTWPSVLPVIESLSPQRVHLAFDADCATKPNVAKCLLDLAEALVQLGLDVHIETWSIDDGKGIDDLLAAGHTPTVRSIDEAKTYLESINTPDLGEGDNAQPPTDQSQETDIAVGSKSEEPNTTSQSVLSFPLHIFPDHLQLYAKQAAEALACSIDLIVIPMLATAATAIGASRMLEAKRSWRESPRLYIACVAVPGAGKSPAETHVTRPLYKRQNRYKASFRKDQEAFESGVPTDSELAEDVQDLELSDTAAPWLSLDPEPGVAADSSEALLEYTSVITPIDAEPVSPDQQTDESTAPAQPILRRIVVCDATTEALGGILADNPRGLILMRDELSAWISSQNQYKGGKGSDRQFYLSCWSGQSAIVDRKSKSEPTMIPRPFLNVLGGIQPDLLQVLIDSEGRSDGFMDRIIFSFPEPIPSQLWTEQAVDVQIEQGWFDTVNRLFDLEMDYCDDEDVYEPRIVRMTVSAKDAWREWYNAHVVEMHADDLPSLLKGPWSKLRSYCLRFILIIHLMRATTDTDIDPEYADDTSVQRAADLMQYFKSHIRKVYTSLQRDDDDRKVELVVNWLRKQGGECTCRTLQRAGVARIKKASEAKEMMRNLADRGLGSLADRPTPQSKGKAVTYFTLDPTVSGSVG